MIVCCSNLQTLSNPVAVPELAEYIKPGMKVACIPLASEHKWLFSEEGINDLAYDGNFFKHHYTPFYHYGVELSDFYVMSPTDSLKFIKTKLKQADIIYFSGGRMENLLDGLKFYKLTNFIKCMESEKIILGESAGAIALCDKYYEYPYGEEYDSYKVKYGLGLLPNVRLVAHYSDDMDMSQLVDLQGQENDPTVLVGLSDSEVMITKGGCGMATVFNVDDGQLVNFELL